MKKTFILLLLLLSTSVFAEIYKWEDASGRVHYSDKAATDKPVETIEVKTNSYTHVSYEVIVDERPAKNRRSKHVTMYSTTRCGYCKKAKKYFIANSIPFTELDIDKSKKARKAYDKLGGKGVPVILVGKKRMNGFSVAGFQKIYQ